VSKNEDLPQWDEIQPLEYRAYEPARRRFPAHWQVVVGVILAVGAVGFSGVIAGASLFNYTYRYPPPVSHARQPSPAASYAVWYLILTMMTVVVFAALPRQRRRGFILGLLIGTALMGLTEGLCVLNG
jgi:hypothetical protein